MRVLNQDTRAQKVPDLNLAMLDEMPSAWRNGTVAIGNFDGVHLGHQAVLAAARAQADHLGGPCILLTFEPHPKQFFAPDTPMFRLTPAPLKAALAEACGLDGMLVVPFNRELQTKSAADFVSEILVDRMQIAHAITGYDFHFGHKRQGTPEYLQNAGVIHNFGVTIVDECDEGGEAVSSTRIRQALKEGEIGEANQLLGWAWSMTGPIVHGEKRGRGLGFPTANMTVEPGNELRHGIYAAIMHRADGREHTGVASFGRRPTFDNGSPLLETFLFDFDGDLYGETVRVALHHFLRPELAFESEQALINQMQADSQSAREMLCGSTGANVAKTEIDERLARIVGA